MGSIILLRSLVLALICAHAAAGLTPLSAAGDDNDCALYLSGPGRTSSYDYSINLLKGNFGYEGRHTCITYDAVNQAYLEARNRIVVSQPKGEWKPEDYGSVGELILDISINLARTYGLTYEEIEKGLPLIDTSRTLIREVCPPVFSHVECRAGKYRRTDGLCNNLHQPTWGATNAPFQRLIGPLFSDGINAPRISHTGRDLPLSRVVSRTMHPDEGFHDHAGTVMVIAWGQFMDHDYTLTGTPLDPRSRNDPEECCQRPPHLKHPYCNEIRIPDDDYFYRLFNVKCIDFVRAFPSPRPGCRLGSRVPYNTLTGAIDGNTVYGVTDKFARKLRTGYGGLLRMNPVFNEYGLKDLLPLKLDIPDEGCTRPNKNMYCFEAGEIRVNEQLILTVMHTLMAREHNRVAEGLAAVNPHWDDETLYQEARRINIAEIQHITYNEFLPILLGKDVMEKFGLVLQKEGFWDGYDPEVNPDVIDAFAAAAYRFGHSLLPTAVERWSKAHKFIASKRLSDLIRRPYDLYRAGVLDEYVMGLMNQVAQAMDDSITQEVTNHLFKKVGARFGMDLVSFNMQRGREFGLPGYMEFRKFCGLPGAETFQDLFGAMANETVIKYNTIFEHPIDVDLWSGGVSERPLPGSMLGPTFACIIATQFSYSRRGDRFWFELPNQPSSFTPAQLHEIRKSRLARVICDNTDIIDTVQLYPMVLPDHELNPRVPCRSGIIPSMDFSKWAEPAPAHRGAAKQFITEAFISPKNETSADDTVVKETENVDSTFKDCKSNSTTSQQSTECEKRIPIINQEDNANLQETLNNETSLNHTDQLFTIHKCSDNSTVTGIYCNKTYVKTKDSHNSDTILKYVNKRDEKTNLKEKPIGHYKNTLSRRKRYAKNFIENARYAASVPVIVSYKTNHAPVVSANIKNTANVIQGLADFNIETLHDNEPKNINSPQINSVSPKFHHQSDKYPSVLNKIKEDYGLEKEYKRVPPNVHNKKTRYSTSLPKNKHHKGYKRTNNIPYKQNHERQEAYKESGENQEGRKDTINKPYGSSDINEDYHLNKANAKSYEESAEKHDYSSEENERRQESAESEDKDDSKPYIRSEEKEYNDDRKTNKPYRESGERNEYDDNKNKKSYHQIEERDKYREDVANVKPYSESEESKEYNDYRTSTRPHHERKEKEENLDDRNAQPYSESGEKIAYKEYNKNGKIYQNDDKDSRENEKSYKGSSERADYRNNEQNKKPYAESDEREDYHGKAKNSPPQESSEKQYTDGQIYSNESEEKSDSSETDTDSFREENDRSKDDKSSYSAPPRDSNESRERESKDKPYSNRASLKEENNGSPNDKSNFIKSRDESEESKENNSYMPDKLPFYQNTHDINQERKNGNIINNNKYPRQPESNESEEEEIIAIMTKKKSKSPVVVSHDGFKNKVNNPLNVSSPINIQEVDLGDFSYETVHINDKGIVVPLRDTHENYGTSNTAEPLTTTPVPGTDFIQSKKLLESLMNVDDPIDDSLNKFAKHTIKINHGEIKPVVEINTDSSEIHDESENNKEEIKSAISNEDTSLETLLGVKTTDDYEQNDKIIEKQSEPESRKKNVKQEFERIPLNYNHDKDVQKQSNKEGTIIAPEDTIEKNTEAAPPTEGTLDTFTPPTRYDDHLNIKFDEEPIKLPEIKLPEDILSYAYEKPSLPEDIHSRKPKFYHYSDEYVDELSQKQTKKKDDEYDDDEDEDDDHHGYYGYHGDERKSDYTSKKKEKNKDEEEDEDEDLYEKFVRERFGKRSFKNHGKSAKLEDLRPVAANTEFYNTLRHVLKKADNVQKEAEKSGDPNAGYMWTLEYGQPL